MVINFEQMEARTKLNGRYFANDIFSMYFSGISIQILLNLFLSSPIINM